MKKIYPILLSLAAIKLFLPASVYAVCPVCTVAVIGGLGISRALGVDDLVTSVWIGGLILSSSFWLTNWIKKSKFKYKSKNLIYFAALFMYLLVLGPLVLTKTIGQPFNTFWGVDKIVLGTAAGLGVFLAGMYLDRLARKKFGKQFFQFQKVVFPVAMLLLASLAFYLITK